MKEMNSKSDVMLKRMLSCNKTIVTINNKLMLFGLFMVMGFWALSQNVGINSTGATPDGSAMLDIDAAPANNKGLLIPRIALAAINQATPVASPAVSLLVYNTATAGSGSTAVIPGYYYWDGTKWIRLQVSSGVSQDWSLTGNAGTSPATNFIGTTDAQDMVIRTNNVEKARITAGGNFGVGTSSPANKMEVVGGWNNNIRESAYSGYASSVFSSIDYTQASHFIGSRARGTILAPTHPLSGDALACFQGRNAINGTGWTGMNIEATENHSNSALGARIKFYTVPNGTTTAVDRMFIGENGKVGIAVNNPYGQFEVNLNTNSSAEPIARFYRSGTGATGFIDFHSGANFGDWSTLTNNGDKSIIFSNDMNPLVDDPTGLLIAPWSGTLNPTGGYKGLKIMENGNVGIGISTPLFALHVNGTTACTGNVWTSDIRKKQNIKPLEFNATDIVMKLNPVTYEWKNVQDIGMQGVQIGFIAQELETVLPGMVVTSDDPEKSKGVKYIELLPIYAKSIQELQQQIEVLKKEIELLKSSR